MAGIKALWTQVFGEDAFWDLFFREAFDPDHCLWLEAGGQVQAALYWFDCRCGGRWAYVFAVATAPACRGKGLCRRLMEKTHETLRARGYDGALLVPAEPGLRKMYGKMGYREATAIDRFSCEAGREALPLRPLTAQDYWTARESFLPEGGVVQPVDMLVLSGAKFYRGENCLFAEDGGGIPEFLGDRGKIPGALAALGCEKAMVRTPGNTVPYAMACPFREDAELPKYFAFGLE